MSKMDSHGATLGVLLSIPYYGRYWSYNVGLLETERRGISTQ